MRHAKPSLDYTRIDAETGELLHNEKGYELPDPMPMAPPVGYNRQPSLSEQIRSMIRSEKLRQELEGTDLETFEEADDFEIGDDYEPSSPYEGNFDPMTDQERAALSSQGKDVDRIIPPEPKKKAAGVQPATDTETPPASKSGETPKA